MGLRDLIFGRLIQPPTSDSLPPSEEAWDVVHRQTELERQLTERRMRRDMVYAQIEGLRGRA